MQPTLSQIQAKRAEVQALRDDALDTLRRLALGRLNADAHERTALVSKFDAYEREFWALIKIERELISHGVATTRRPSMEGNDSSPLPSQGAESRFDAPLPVSAVITPPTPSDAPDANRRATPMPAAESVTENQGSVSTAPWGSPEAHDMTAQHYASRDGF